jgi:hypothetical protein
VTDQVRGTVCRVCGGFCQGGPGSFIRDRPTGVITHTPWKEGGWIPKGREAGMMLSCVEGSRKKWLSMAAPEHGSSPCDNPTVLFPCGEVAQCVWIKKNEGRGCGVGCLDLNLERSVDWLPG